MTDRTKWAEDRLAKMRLIAHMSDHQLSRSLAQREQDHNELESQYPDAVPGEWLLLLREAACRRLMNKEY